MHKVEAHLKFAPNARVSLLGAHYKESERQCDREENAMAQGDRKKLSNKFSNSAKGKGKLRKPLGPKKGEC